MRTIEDIAAMLGPPAPVADPVTELVAFADECHAQGDAWMERLALKDALEHARQRGDPRHDAIWDRIDALEDEPDIAQAVAE